MPFVKLDCDITKKSIWSESSDTKVVWITLLTMADRDGVVRASVTGISRCANVPITETTLALQKFQEPDPDSTDQENSGKRIDRIPEGYVVLNYEKYRERDHSSAARSKRYRDNLATRRSDTLRHAASVSVILSYLNNKTNKKYRNTKYILARLEDGYTKEQLMGVIDTKLCDPHFRDNPHLMNPVTLFRPSHIDNYINQSGRDFKKPSWGGIASEVHEVTRDERIANLKEKIREMESGELDEPSVKLLARLKENLVEMENG